MDAAQELFASIGFDATKMDHIAKRAGVSRQTVYEYSISKEEIYRSVLGRSAQRYVEALDRIDQRQEPRAVLADVLAAMIDEYLGSSRLLLMDVALHQQIVPPANTRDAARAYRRVIGRALTRGKAQGVFDPNAGADVFQAHAMALLSGFAFSSRLLTEVATVDCVSAAALALWRDYLTDSMLRWDATATSSPVSGWRDQRCSSASRAPIIGRRLLPWGRRKGCRQGGAPHVDLFQEEVGQVI